MNSSSCCDQVNGPKHGRCLIQLDRQVQRWFLQSSLVAHVKCAIEGVQSWGRMTVSRGEGMEGDNNVLMHQMHHVLQILLRKQISVVGLKIKTILHVQILLKAKQMDE